MCIRDRKKAAAAGLPAPASYELGQAREVADPHALYESEYRQQYRSLPFWKRSVILLAGIFMNLLFAMLVFIIVFSIIGFQVQHPETGEITTCLLYTSESTCRRVGRSGPPRCRERLPTEVRT